MKLLNDPLLHLMILDLKLQIVLILLCIDLLPTGKVVMSRIMKVLVLARWSRECLTCWAKYTAMPGALQARCRWWRAEVTVGLLCKVEPSCRCVGEQIFSPTKLDWKWRQVVLLNQSLTFP